jgi:hypothetical protein
VLHALFDALRRGHMSEARTVARALQESGETIGAHALAAHCARIAVLVDNGARATAETEAARLDAEFRRVYRAVLGSSRLIADSNGEVM